MTSSLRPVCMGTEQREVCSRGLVIEAGAAVWLQLRLSPSKAEEAETCGDVGRAGGTEIDE